jgi:hypothetical protein
MSHRQDKPSYTFSVTSGFGVQSRQPFVEVEVLPTEFSVKMSPQDATTLALNLLQAAEAARTDGWLVNYLTGSAGLTNQEMQVMLVEFRHWRATHE